MSIALTIELVRTVACDRCRKVEEVRKTVTNDWDGKQAKAFREEASPWKSRIEFLSLHMGWHGNHNSTPMPGHGPQWKGDLCPDCTETMRKFIAAFLADGVSGMIQMAKETPVEEVEIPF